MKFIIVALAYCVCIDSFSNNNIGKKFYSCNIGSISKNNFHPNFHLFLKSQSINNLENYISKNISNSTDYRLKDNEFCENESLSKANTGEAFKFSLILERASILVLVIFCFPFLVEAATGIDRVNVAHSIITDFINSLNPVISSVFGAGLISGAVSRTSKELILHPLDTIRARLQSTTPLNSFNVTYEYLFKDLYSGVIPALVSAVPAGALFFAVKDSTRRQLRIVGIDSVSATLVAVAAANIPYWILRCPAEKLKTRQQAGITDNNLSVNELLMNLKSVYRKGGWQAILNDLYGSYISNYVYALPADIIKFLIYEQLSGAGGGRGVHGDDDRNTVTAFTAATFGAIAGLIAQGLTTPLDVVRTRVMIAAPTDNIVTSTSPLTVFNTILNTEGLKTLFAGLTPRLIRAIGSGAIQFASYEVTQNLIHKL